MCRAVTCTTCGLTTWAGCGQHVDSVMAGVPRSQRCPGHADSGQPAHPVSGASGQQPSDQDTPKPRTLRLFPRRSR